MSESKTPRTNAAVIHIEDDATGDYVSDHFARQLETDLAAANSKLDAILKDVNYKGGLQDWIQKHDALLLSLATEHQMGKMITTEADLFRDERDAALAEVEKLRAGVVILAAALQAIVNFNTQLPCGLLEQAARALSGDGK